MKSMRVCIALGGMIGMLILAGCAGSLPVPGGDEQVNSKIYQSQQDLVDRVNKLVIGMSEGNVLTILNRKEGDLARLSRPEIMEALYGGSNSGFNGTYEQQEKARLFLQSLNGFKLTYVSIAKEHGFSSPIRIKTHESGYRYTVTIVFQNGVLFDKPVLSGGEIEGYSSKTVFDYLNPGSFMNLR